MKFLVTGATGFMGANLVRRLVTEEQALVYITARETSNFWRLGDLKMQIKRICFADLSERKKVFNLIRELKPDIIFHLACYGGLRRQTEKDLILKANLSSTVNLLDAAVENEVGQFINTGSSSEYGPKEQPMREDDFCEPLSFYGITKLAATNYCAMIGKAFNYPVCTLRLFSPFGKYENESRLYPTIVAALQKGDAPKLAQPDLVRDFIEVEKVVEVYLKIINCPYQPGDIINLGSGKQRSIKEFYDSIAVKLGSKIEPRWNTVPVRNNEPRRWEADISKLKALMTLNWD
jgi:nucleoside-diphosphate-sugar epimerase